MNIPLPGAICACLMAAYQIAACQTPHKDQGASSIPEIMWWQCGGELTKRQLQKKAAGGDAHAKAQLAYRMTYTREFEPDGDKVFRLFKESADSGDGLGHSGLANCYSSGMGCKLNHDLEFKHAKASAKTGNHLGIFLLGRCYEFGRGVKPDQKRAMEIYKQAADAGEPWAKYWVAYTTRFDPLLREKNMAILDELAKQDFPVAIMVMGLEQIDQGNKKAGIAELGRSARLGLSYAMAVYGKTLIKEGEISEGTEWILESIDRGSFMGNGELAKLLFADSNFDSEKQSNRITGSAAATFHFLNEAYLTGIQDPNVLGCLAHHYISALGTKKNDKLAIKLINDAWRLYDLGHESHNCDLASYSSNVYFRADAPDQDFAKAIAYERYRQHPSAASMAQLAWYYSLQDQKDTYDPVKAWATILTMRQKNFHMDYLDAAIPTIESWLDANQLKQAQELSDRGFPCALEFQQEAAIFLKRPVPVALQPH